MKLKKLLQQIPFLVPFWALSLYFSQSLKTFLYPSKKGEVAHIFSILFLPHPVIDVWVSRMVEASSWCSSRAAVAPSTRIGHDTTTPGAWPVLTTVVLSKRARTLPPPCRDEGRGKGRSERGMERDATNLWVSYKKMIWLFSVVFLNLLENLLSII